MSLIQLDVNVVDAVLFGDEPGVGEQEIQYCHYSVEMNKMTLGRLVRRHSDNQSRFIMETK